MKNPRWHAAGLARELPNYGNVGKDRKIKIER